MKKSRPSSILLLIIGCVLLLSSSTTNAISLSSSKRSPTLQPPTPIATFQQSSKKHWDRGPFAMKNGWADHYNPQQQQRNNNKWPKIIDAENDLIHKHGTNNIAMHKSKTIPS